MNLFNHTNKIALKVNISSHEKLMFEKMCGLLDRARQLKALMCQQDSYNKREFEMPLMTKQGRRIFYFSYNIWAGGGYSSITFQFGSDIDGTKKHIFTVDSTESSCIVKPFFNGTISTQSVSLCLLELEGILEKEIVNYKKKNESQKIKIKQMLNEMFGSRMDIKG